jgi:glucose-1-phosphate thymidylyltransferase
MQYLIDNNIKEKGEYQLTNALENMKAKGAQFYPGKVIEWLDCGNKDATVYTNGRVLENNKSSLKVPSSVRSENSQIIQPCFLGENVQLNNSIIGPYVSVGAGTKIENSIVTNSIIQSNAKIKNSVLNNSMIGNNAEYVQSPEQLSLSDYSTHY